MSNIYNEEYYKNYDVGVGKVDYEGSQYTQSFLKTIAGMIVEKYHPKTVLDAGCAMGYLVEALRDLGVEAYGVDISEYAIGKVREDIKPYCAVRSLLDPLPEHFPKKFDMVTTVEVIEHIEEEQGLQALKNLCSYTDTILFSSSPDDFEEPTHVNVRPPEYWVSHFAQNGFYNNVEINNDYLTPWTLFVSRTQDVSKVVATYERRVQENKRQLGECRQKLEKATQKKEEISVELIATKESLARTEEKHANALKELSVALEQHQELFAEFSVMKELYEAIVGSFFWKITKPLRYILDCFKRVFSAGRYKRILRAGINSLKRDGLKATWFKTLRWLGGSKSYETYMKMHQLSEKERKEQEKAVFDRDITFSILVPLYNTPENFLCEMIESVISQTYAKWELCLADGSDAEHGHVGEIAERYSRKDKRIKYKKLAKNNGISENTNASRELATGEYLALLDHDDLLTFDALFEMAKAINGKNPDVLYSDEDKVDENRIRRLPFFKPDFNRDLLYSQMYICHLLVFKSALFDKLGGLRDVFSGSQDYDFILRLTEHTDKIHHISKVLYSWRETVTSTSINPDSKPYAHDAGKSALKDHLKRKYGDIARAEDGAYLFCFDTRFDLLSSSPKISIVIPVKDKTELTQQCINSILEKTTYSNYEILILNNRSEEPQTYAYFGDITASESRVKVVDADFEFNWSKLNNFGMSHATGEIYVFLNNDTKIISPDWLERLAENALREDIGVVGALLLYEDDTIQHAGVVVGMNHWADHVFKGHRPEHFGHGFVSPMLNRDVTAVTGACMAISKKVIEKIGPFNEEFIICGSDVEICLRAIDKGLRVLYDAYVRLYHLESKSRDSYIPPVDFELSDRFYQKYREQGDPNYNKNLDINSTTPICRR